MNNKIIKKINVQNATATAIIPVSDSTTVTMDIPIGKWVFYNIKSKKVSNKVIEDLLKENGAEKIFFHKEYKEELDSWTQPPFDYDILVFMPLTDEEKAEVEKSFETYEDIQAA